MRPVTESIPKALVPVLGRPFADLQLEWLAAGGVTEVVYCVGYKGELLRAHVGDGRRWGLRATWVDEGDQLRGTAGALRLAYDEGVLDERFLVLYGDSYLPIEIGPVWAAAVAAGAPGLMTVLRNEGRWDASNAELRGDRVTLYDKYGQHPGRPLAFIDYGLSVLTRAVVAERVPPGEVADLSVVFHDLSVAGQLAGLEVHERFFEVGSPAGLADLEAFVRGRGEGL